MREMRMEKISWVKREMKRTRKLPSKATITTTMMTSHTPTHTLPTMYSMPWDLQNWMKETGGKQWDHTDQKTGHFTEIWICFSVITHSKEGLLKHQQRTRETNNQDGLSCNEAEDDPLNAGGDEELWNAHHVVHLISCRRKVDSKVLLQDQFHITAVLCLTNKDTHLAVLQRWWQETEQRSR